MGGEIGNKTEGKEQINCDQMVGAKLRGPNGSMVSNSGILGSENPGSKLSFGKPMTARISAVTFAAMKLAAKTNSKDDENQILCKVDGEQMNNDHSEGADIAIQSEADQSADKS
jgi:hypothetical protein